MIKENDFERLACWFPSEDWEKLFWGFTCYSRQDYAGKAPLDAEDEIILGIQYPDGGCLAEMGFRWYKLDGALVPRLEVFSDAWQLLQTRTVQMVISQLVNGSNPRPTPDELSELLITWGFIDQSDNPLTVQADDPLVVPAVTEGTMVAKIVKEGKDNA